MPVSFIIAQVAVHFHQLIHSKSISEIATHLGFDSLRSFSALFVRMEGMSPTEYRALASLSK